MLRHERLRPQQAALLAIGDQEQHVVRGRPRDERPCHGTERGLLGAQAFMAQPPAAASLRAVVNLDARGAAGPAAIFELGPQSAWLSDVIDGFVPAPRTQSLAVAIYERMPNGTDFTVFLKAGASGFNVAFIGDVAAYHRPEDTVERQSAWT
ncbi:MAG: M28 family peptidase, partial [Phycisphaerales bacterium]